MIPGLTAFGMEPFNTLPGAYDLATRSPFQDLLADPLKPRVYLMHATPYDPVAAAEVDVYIANKGFPAHPADVPTVPHVSGRLDSILNYEASLFNTNDLSGPTRSGGGAMTITNPDGALDHLNDYAWDGRTLEIKMGSPDARLFDFGAIFRGTADQAVWDEEQITIRLRDRQEILDIPIQQTFYAGTGGLEGGADLKGKPKPVCLGRPRSITPVLVDPVNRIYQWHFRASQAEGVVRFAGNIATPGIDYTADLANSTLTLINPPGGEVTMDPEGDNVGGYVESVPAVIRRMWVDLGGLVDPDDLDVASIDNVEAIKPAACGVYIGTETASISGVTSELISSIGGFWGANRLGLFRLGLVLQPGTAVETIEATRIKSIRRLETPRPVNRTRFGYAKNYTLQTASQLATSLPDSDPHRTFAREAYRFETAEDAAVEIQHLLPREREILSLLAFALDAANEATGSQALFGVDRHFYAVDLDDANHQRDLGKVIELKHPRFGLSAGKKFSITEIRENARSDEQRLVVWG